MNTLIRLARFGPLRSTLGGSLRSARCRSLNSPTAPARRSSLTAASTAAAERDRACACAFAQSDAVAVQALGANGRWPLRHRVHQRHLAPSVGCSRRPERHLTSTAGGSCRRHPEHTGGSRNTRDIGHAVRSVGRVRRRRVARRRHSRVRRRRCAPCRGGRGLVRRRRGLRVRQASCPRRGWCGQRRTWRQPGR